MRRELILLAMIIACSASAPAEEPARGGRPTAGILGRKASGWEAIAWRNLPAGKTALDVPDFSGKVVYLFCFQSWCPGCHKTGFPALQKLVTHYKDADDVAFVAIQTVFEGFQQNTPEKAWACAKKYDLEIPFGHAGPEGARAAMMSRYGMRGTPWAAVIDAKGIVRANDFFIPPEKAITLIDRLRKEAKESAGEKPDIGHDR